MASATISGVTGLQRKLNNIQKTSQVGVRKALIKIVGDARQQMSDRTQAGKDVNYKEFKPYSPAYILEKAEAKKNTSPVNLTFKADMLKAMQVRQIKKGAEIYFNNESEKQKARAHNSGLGQKKRNFFGLGTKIKKYILDEVSKIISKAVKR